MIIDPADQGRLNRVPVKRVKEPFTASFILFRCNFGEESCREHIILEHGILCVYQIRQHFCVCLRATRIKIFLLMKILVHIMCNRLLRYMILIGILFIGKDYSIAFRLIFHISNKTLQEFVFLHAFLALYNTNIELYLITINKY